MSFGTAYCIESRTGKVLKQYIPLLLYQTTKNEENHTTIICGNCLNFSAEILWKTFLCQKTVK